MIAYIRAQTIVLRRAVFETCYFIRALLRMVAVLTEDARASGVVYRYSRNGDSTVRATWSLALSLRG
jgi:hypothetical protein